MTAGLPSLFVLAALAAPPIKSPGLGKDAGFTRPRFQWDVPDVIQVIDVPGKSDVNGLPVEFHAVISKANFDDIGRYIVERFRKQHLYIPPADQQMKMSGGAVQITALDVDNLISYTAILQRNGEMTTVVLGESNLAEKKHWSGSDFAPAPPGAEGLVRSTQEGLRTMSFTLKADDADPVRFYRDVLPKSGYVVEPGDNFRRGYELIEVRINKLKPGLGVLLIHRISAPDSVQPAKP